MSKFYYYDEDGKAIYIKTVDYANEKLEFTEDSSEAYRDRNGYYVDPTRDYICFHFKDKYPEVENLVGVETYEGDEW